MYVERKQYVSAILHKVMHLSSKSESFLSFFPRHITFIFFSHAAGVQVRSRHQ